MSSSEVGPPLLLATSVEVSLDSEVLLPRCDIAVHAGEIVALTGPNGSGKTTLLRVLAGLLPPSSGTALVCGEAPEPRDPRFRGALAALIGTPPLARDLTLSEHLELVSLSWGSVAQDAEVRAAEMLELLRIPELARRFPHELSSGQQQLFALCLTLIRPSEVLLLDEPEQRLDGERRALLAGVLRDRADAGSAVLMATHSAELTQATGSRIVSLGGSRP